MFEFQKDPQQYRKPAGTRALKASFDVTHYRALYYTREADVFWIVGVIETSWDSAGGAYGAKPTSRSLDINSSARRRALDVEGHTLEVRKVGPGRFGLKMHEEVLYCSITGRSINVAESVRAGRPRYRRVQKKKPITDLQRSPFHPDGVLQPTPPRIA